MIKRAIDSKHSIKWFLLAHFSVWTLVSCFLDIHPDMADHWVWSRYLDWGYYEHPPMVAWMMWLAANILPIDPVISLKIGSVLISTLILWLAYRVASSMYSRKTALIYLLILESTLYFSVGSVFWHIDQPYMISWLLGLLVVSKFLQTKEMRWILLFGVIGGLGAVSKYIMVLFYLSLLFWCLFDKRFRYLLTSWQSYAAGLISFILFLPVFLWNATHDWISFRFQFGRGLKGGGLIGQLPELTIAHLLLFSGVFSVMVWVLLIRKRIPNRPISEKASFLLATGLFPLIFFSVSSLRGTIADPHWLNITYFSVFILLAEYLRKRIEKGGKVNGLFISAYLINILLVGFVLVQIHYRIIPVDVSGDPTKKMVGWSETASQIEAVLEENQLGKPDFVVTREYQLGGALSLYMKDSPMSHSIEKAERNTWSPVDKVKESSYFLACPPKECVGVLKKAEKRFQVKFDYLQTIHARNNGHLIRTLLIYAPNR